MAKLSKPVSLAPVKALAAKDQPAAKDAPVVKAAPSAPVVETPSPAAVTPVVAAPVVAATVVPAPAAVPAPVIAKAAEPIVVPVPKVATDKTVATKAPAKAKAPEKAKAPVKVAAKPDQPKVETVKPDVTKAPAPAPVEAKVETPVVKTQPRLTVVQPTPKAPEVKAAASFAFPEISLSGPAFGQEFASAWIGQIARAGRTLAEVQARLLDHGVHELKAGLGEVEAIARAGTPSEVVMLQAKAFRRSADALVDTVSEVSAVARKGMIAR